jgi:hypothetical protein
VRVTDVCWENGKSCVADRSSIPQIYKFVVCYGRCRYLRPDDLMDNVLKSVTSFESLSLHLLCGGGAEENGENP